MLDLAMKAITMQLNRYMHDRFDLDEDSVVLSTPYDPDGNIASKVNNKLVVFLSNITKDTLPSTSARLSSSPSMGSSFTSSAPLYLNLYVVIGACFDAARYPEALKYLSHAVGCFQQNPVIDGHSYPELSNSIHKLIIDIENVSLNELSNMWGILGGTYLPSILYKVRMVVVASDAIVSRELNASVAETSTRNR